MNCVVVVIVENQMPILYRYHGLIPRYLALVLACALAVAAVMFGVASMQDKQYAGVVQLRISPEQGSDSDATAQRELLNQVTILKSRDISDAAAARLGNVTSADVAGSLTFDVSSESDIVTIRTQNASADEARRVVNAVAEAYVDRRRAERVARDDDNNALRSSPVAIVQPGVPSDDPVAPQPKRTAALSAVLVFVLVTVALMIREQLFPRIRDADDIRNLTQKPVFVGAPLLGGSTALAAEQVAIAQEDVSRLVIVSLAKSHEAPKFAVLVAQELTTPQQQALLVQVDSKDGDMSELDNVLAGENEFQISAKTREALDRLGMNDRAVSKVVRIGGGAGLRGNAFRQLIDTAGSAYSSVVVSVERPLSNGADAESVAAQFLKVMLLVPLGTKLIDFHRAVDRITAVRGEVIGYVIVK
jgi:capsular polysaccharide biosynthesis protein